MKPAISPKHREPNGRAQRLTTKAQIEEAQRRAEEKEKATVYSQPHRKGERSQKAENALGRVCLSLRLPEECYRAGEEYAALYRRWCLVIAHMRVEGHKSLGAMQEEPSAEAIAKIEARLFAAEAALRSVMAYAWVRHVVVDHPTCSLSDLPPDAFTFIRRGLNVLTDHFGMRLLTNPRKSG